MKNRTFLQYFVITLKGMAMGAADVVPGVSGGTIAFIAGIYEELIDSINRVNLSALSTLRKRGIRAAWNQVNGNFFLALLLGIGISVVSLARGISYLLDNEPVMIWSFFFGLVLASIFIVGRQVRKWDSGVIRSFIAGVVIAYAITILPASPENTAYWFLFISGALAICAMILPGISGSFILVLLGSYGTVLAAVHEMNLAIIATLAAGAVIGLLSFARLLKLMFVRFHNITIALLSGFLLGSLNKIWPWKRVDEILAKDDGEWLPVVETSVWPGDYTLPIIEAGQVTGHQPANSDFWPALLLCLSGMVVILLLERLSISKPADS